ncbi:chromosome partitioning protein [Micromonospora chersina]|uniref:MinD/ParA family ATP-binding protein n=1 Tax=Micromonospora chersina TaxID=47854 RepID=UPI0036B12948
MVHEHADRAHVPGQPQVPERDIEPLWPPEQADPVVTAPPWAAPAQPNAAPWPVPPGDTAPSTPWPQPPAPDEGRAGETVPAPRAAQPPVDLDLPFTLDQPAPTPAATTPEPTAPRPATAGPDDTAHTSGSAPEAATPVTAAPRPARAAADGAGSDASAADGDTPAGQADSPAGHEAGTPANGRPDSPWAQPPQRTTVDPTTPGPHTDPVTPSAQAGAESAAYPPATPPGTVGPTQHTTGPTPPHTASSTQPTTAGATQPAAGPTPTHAPDPPRPTSGSAASGQAAPAVGATTPAQAASHDGPQSAARTADGSPEGETPRLGPFPPSPGVPLPQSYGDGTAYPPGPVGYGQPAPGPGGYGQPTPGPAGYGPPTPAPQAGPAARPPHAGPPAPGPQANPAAPVPQAGAPGWYPPAWPQQSAPPPQPGAPQQQPAPQAQPAPPQQHGMQQPGPAAYPEQVWTPASGTPPTAEDFARRRQVRPVDPVATMGVRAVVNRIGLVRLAPGRQEQEMRRDIEMVRRNFGGLRQVTVVNPKGGAGKTVAILLLAMTFGQKRGGYVLAWDNNETQGTLGMRAQQDFHSRTVRDMLRDLAQFQGPHGRVGDLSQYVRSQGEGMFDVLASDESATGGEMLTAAAFAEIREVVSRFYKLIFVDTGNNVRAQNWQAAMDATDQLVVTMSARNDSAETAARMLDHLEQSGRQRLVRQAVTVVSMPPSRKEIDLPAIQEHFAARTRAVLLAPYERLIDTGEPIRYGQLSSATRDAWLKIAASVAEGL